MSSTLAPGMLLLLQQAARRLLDGGIVGFPTETVYGLGADAENTAALAKIYAIKGRPANHPVIVHLAPGADVAYWASSISPEAQRLMDAFWPGPLTLIVPRADHIPSAVSGDQDSIGLRCPSHPVAQALLQHFAALKPGGHGGVAAPSANRFGHVSPTRADHVRAEFPDLDGAALMVLDGGTAQVGIESTIVDVSRLERGIGPVLLRPGHISAVQIETVLGMRLEQRDAAAPRVSGSLKAHYAPQTPLMLLPLDQLLDQAQQAQPMGQRLAAVVFDASVRTSSAGVHWHIMARDPHVYAHELYALLRQLDAGGYTRILLERPPAGPAWQAVNDRVGRAAAAFG